MFSNFILVNARAVSAFGDYLTFLFGLMLFIVLLLVLKKYYLYALILLLAQLSYFFSLLLKGYFQVPRPSLIGVHINFPQDIYSFPSSHVIYYVSVLGYLVYLMFHIPTVRSWLRWLLLFVCMYLILGIGVSRVILGVHHIQDAIAGYLFGGLYLSVLLVLQKLAAKYKSKNNKVG